MYSSSLSSKYSSQLSGRTKVHLQQNAGLKLFTIVIVPTVSDGAKAWGMRNERKVNALQMKCLRRFVGVSRTDS